MHLTKAQGIVITLLNIIIVALIAVVMFVPTRIADGAAAGGTNDQNGGNTDTPPDNITDDPPEPAHNKYREATDGKADGIARETQLMGLGDETVIRAYERDGYTYVFGNAPVSGLDFDSYGGYVCVLDGTGKIISYRYVTGNIEAVGKLSDGYAAAAGGKIYHVSYAGIPTEKTAYTGTAADIFTADNSTVSAVTQTSSESLTYTEYAVSPDGVWNAGRTTRIESGYSLKFFDCYSFGSSYAIAARAHSLPRYDALVIYTFTPGGDATAHYYGGQNENLTRPYAVLPYSDGYMSIVSRNGVATVLTVDYKFTTTNLSSLGFTFFDARMFYTGGKYYACFERVDGAVTYELGASERKRVTTTDGISVSAAVQSADGGVLFIGTTSQTVATGAETASASVCIAENTGSVQTLEISNANIYAAYTENGRTTVVLSASGGSAVSAPSAGRDVYILTLSFK